MIVNLLLKLVLISLLFLILIFFGLLLPSIPSFLRVMILRIWILSLICFPQIPSGFCRARNNRCLSRSVQCALLLIWKAKLMMVLFLCCPFTVYKRVLAQLAAFDLTEAEGARIRSRVKWAEEGETSSRFPLRLERKREADTWISATKTLDGSTVSDIDGIWESWVSFYSDLFSASSVNLDFQVDLLDNLSLSLSCDESATCEGPISLTEGHAALLGMAKGKSSGSDGLPMKFYVTFWEGATIL